MVKLLIIVTLVKKARSPAIIVTIISCVVGVRQNCYTIQLCTQYMAVGKRWADPPPHTEEGGASFSGVASLRQIDLSPPHQTALKTFEYTRCGDPQVTR